MQSPSFPARRLATKLRWTFIATSALILALVATSVLVIGRPALAGTCQNLIPDSGFESGTNWTASTQGSYSLFSQYLVHNGSKAAYLGGTDGAVDSLSTTLNLPNDPVLTLNFWWQVQSEEKGGSYDGMSMVVADAQGNPLRTIFSLSDANVTSFWQNTEIDLSEFAGQTVQLKLIAQTDANLPTDFFIDDLTVNACSASSGSGMKIFLPFTQH